MEQMDQNPPRRPNPRRKKRDPKKVFLESHLPVILGAALLVLIIGLIIASSTKKDDRAEEARRESLAARESQEAQLSRDRQEAEEVMARAKALADSYDYEGAIALLDGFGSRIFQFDDMLQMLDGYEKTLENLVSYDGDDVVHLSVQVLIAEPERAFQDSNYGSSYKKNFISTREFRNLLEELYANGYVLVDMADLTATVSDETGTILHDGKTVLLPPGKQPLMLTQTQVNYYSYMVDPDGDGKADKNGAGFASRLILQDGILTNEMVDAQGNTVTGSFDLVPILEEFIEQHPDFSYHGARAILAVTGYNGIFGYRGETLADAAPVVAALKEKGYRMAYYTYYNTSYADASAAKIADELQRWEKNISPVLGETEFMVYALSGDIAKADTPYSGEKFAALQDAGLRYYLGFCTDGQPWFMQEGNYVRMGRILANAENLSKNPQWFAGICAPTAVLAENR